MVADLVLALVLVTLGCLGAEAVRASCRRALAPAAQVLPIAEAAVAETSLA